MITSYCWCGYLSFATAAAFPKRNDLRRHFLLPKGLSRIAFWRGASGRAKHLCVGKIKRMKVIGLCVCVYVFDILLSSPWAQRQEAAFFSLGCFFQVEGGGGGWLMVSIERRTCASMREQCDALPPSLPVFDMFDEHGALVLPA